MTRPTWLVLLLLIPACGENRRQNSPATIRPVRATDPVGSDADDVALWIDPIQPERSLILGTDKGGASGGSLHVYGLDGKQRQVVPGIARPNNVDVEYGLSLGGRRVDVAVVTERGEKRLRVFRIAPDGSGVEDVSSPGGLAVFAGEEGRRAEPMGVGLYRRPSDGVVFAIVSRKDGPREGYLWQYRLEDDGAGRVRAVRVRALGRFSGQGEIEAVAVDDALGYVYYADETAGIRKWHADPGHPEAGRELAVFGSGGFRGDREGIGIYQRPGGAGYIVCSDQVRGGSRLQIFSRAGEPGAPHRHPLLKVVADGADETDGIEVSSSPAGPSFAHGLVVVMNSRGKNFLVYRWEDLAAAGLPRL